MLDENNSIAVKKRGRPPGAVREVFFIISAIDENGQLIQEKIIVTRGENITKEDMRIEACAIFEGKFNIKPNLKFVKGPCFDANLTQTSSPKRESPKFSEENVSWTNRKIQADFGDWRVLGRYFIDEDGVERTDFVRVTFRYELFPGEKKRARPNDAFKAVSELKNIKELTPNSEQNSEIAAE